MKTTRDYRVERARNKAASKFAKVSGMPTDQARRIVAAVLDVLPESGFCVTYGRKRIDSQPR